MTIDQNSWGYRKNANLNEYFTSEELIKILAMTVSFGGKMN